MDTLGFNSKEYIDYLKSRVRKFTFWIYTVNIIGIPLLIPFVLCLFFSYPIEYGVVSLILIWLHCHIHGLCRDLKSDAIDRLKRWNKIYEKTVD